MHTDLLTGIKYIALVGKPKSGKSLVQSILAKNYDVRPIDSGLPLREIAMTHYGLTADQVFTQEGKLKLIEILGRTWQVRELLGELGNRFEEMHGDQATPWMVTRRISDTDPGPFCDAACRKKQGLFYKSLGGVVIGIRRPDVPNSIYEFDHVHEEVVDIWINNDALARGMNQTAAFEDLECKVDKTISLLARYRAA